MQEKYLRSIEARLQMQSELIQHLFALLYSDDPSAFAKFMKSQTEGLWQHKPASGRESSEEGVELRVEIKMQLDLWGRKTGALIQGLQKE